jgi:hypothetical protein
LARLHPARHTSGIRSSTPRIGDVFSLETLIEAAAVALPLAAQAADLPVRRAAPVAAAPFNWTGVYIGAGVH